MLVSRTMVPIMIDVAAGIMQFFHRALKSVSVGRCAVVATTFMPIALVSATTPASTSLPKSES